MFTTLTKLIVNKSFDVAHIQVWSMELAGVFSALRMIYGRMLRFAYVSAGPAEEALEQFTVTWQHASIEAQRKLAIELVDILAIYLMGGDSSEAVESFERTLEDYSRFVSPLPTTPQSARNGLPEILRSH